jgi:hypothetical protein
MKSKKKDYHPPTISSDPAQFGVYGDYGGGGDGGGSSNGPIAVMSPFFGLCCS